MNKFVGIVFLLLCGVVAADVVNEIVFEGLDRVEKSAIEEAVTIKPNKKYSQSDIDSSLKALFKKDFFSHIKFIKRGDTLVVQCKEKPMINKVLFDGNESISEEDLKNVINGRVGEGRLFSSHIIKDILSDFQVNYRALGYCAVKIAPQFIRHDGNKVDLIFKISEGTKTTIKKIMFIGNKSFSDEELKDIISTKEEKIWRFWAYDSHIFREDKIDADIESLSAFYKNRGYPFFMVTSTSLEMSFDKKSNYCTFSLEEGDKYTIKSVNVESKIEKIKADDYKKFTDIKLGSEYNEALINGCKDAIRRNIALSDNPFTDVVVDANYNKVNKTVDIKYVIVKRPKEFVEKIEIVGNMKTVDRVIRREFSIHEGDAYNAYKIKDTIDNLKCMEYFDDVQVTETKGSADDKKILIVNVKEKESTAQFRFGLNVSDADGFGGFVGFVENNLMGTGRVLTTDVFWMQRYYGCKLGIYDPKFMDQNFGAGLNIGASSYNRKKVDHSITKSAYISPFIKYGITPHLTHRIGYTVSFNDKKWHDHCTGKMHNKVPDNAGYAPLIKEEFGRYIMSEIASTLFYNQTDNFYDPRNGYSLSLMNAYAGVGGAVKYFKNEIGGDYYYPISQKVTFITSAHVGYIKEISGVRSAHRYALGGDGANMRGFDSYGIGTRDTYGNSVGGNKYWTLSFMLKAPLSTREMGINGVIFWDLGSAWGTKYQKQYVQDSSAIRSSVGVAIEWAKSPLGIPLSFVFGFALKKKKFDEKQTFTLTGLM